MADDLQVDTLTLYEVAMDLVTPFAASSHRAGRLRHVLVHLRAGDHEGWGECATAVDPYYVEETTDGAWDVLAGFLAPRVVGRRFASVAALAQDLAVVKGNGFARGAVEMAALDLVGRQSGRSVASLLGGTRPRIEVGVSLGLERDLGRLHALVERHVAEGYRRVKVKVMPGWDRAPLEALRRAWPELPLVADANSAYRLSDAPQLATLDDLDLQMLEQPLAWDDFLEHAELQRQLRTPLCLDESIRSLHDARLALTLGAARILNVKPGRVGGLLEARAIHDLCHAAGVPVWCGGMHEYGIGRAANVALASLPGFTLPGDVSGSDKYFAEDLVDPPILAPGGIVPVPIGSPGLGVRVVEERRAAKTLRTFVLGG